VAAIYRKNAVIFPKYETVVEEGDRMFFVAASNDIKHVLGLLFNENRPHKRLIIAGGGRIGQGLAKELEQHLQVKIITKNGSKAIRLSEELNHTIVLTGDASDESLLLDENIEKTDVFCSVTSDDETNILCSMLAKSLGSRVVMSIVDRNAYMSMVDNGSIDNAIYPQHTTIGRILSQIRQGKVSQVHSLLRGKAEAFEAVAQGSAEDSSIVGKSVESIKLPENTAIIAIIRDGESLPARGSLVIEESDHVIVFIADKSQVHAVEALFEPKKSLFKRLVS
jgi:trk system potassium uptake protein TrkA